MPFSGCTCRIHVPKKHYRVK